MRKLFLINMMGNINDIRDSIRLGNYTLDDFREALEDEKSNHNRKGVITLLEKEIAKLEKEVSNG